MPKKQDGASGKRRGGPAPEKDISSVLSGWEYEPGTINVRMITGADGMPKIQMRLDLGLLQMEIAGRPDGAKPHGCESWLEYIESLRDEHRTSHGSDEGFALSAEQCQHLREEALMYYHRYLSLFVLGEFHGVARDTARNLRAIDLCEQYAQEDEDKFALEQYRPYILMMNARARASLALRRKNFERALRIVRRALRKIKAFFEKYGQEKAYRHANEVRLLKRFARDIKGRMPLDPLEYLQRQLKSAVADERYEDAARLRDEITKMGGSI